MTFFFRIQTSTNYVEPTGKVQRHNFAKATFQATFLQPDVIVLALPALGDTHYSRSRTLNRVTKDSRITCMCIAAILPLAKRGFNPIHANDILGPIHRIIKQQILHRLVTRLVCLMSLAA